MANACVDALQFDTDANGRLQLRNIFQQSAAHNFTHTLTGAQGVYEVVNELTALTIPAGQGGLWEVTADIRGVADNTPAGPGTVVGTSVSAAIGVNGVVSVGSETMVQLNTQGAPGAGETEPSLQQQGTSSVTRILTLNAGDVITVMAARVSDLGTNSRVVSDNRGRTRLLIRRLGA